MISDRAKTWVGAGLAAPGVRHGLRWFLNQSAFPDAWRDLAHRKLAKRARFPASATFEYQVPGGARLRFLHQGTPNYLYWRNSYEPHTMAVFCTLAARASTILDIGASAGVFALTAAAIRPSARVLAFEPGRDAASACQRNIELNLPVSSHVELHAIALGDEECTTTLFVAGSEGGASSLNPRYRPVTRPQEVRVRRGDGVLAERGVDHVDLIKMDTESTEPFVIRGLAKTLERDRPDLICEILYGRTERQIEELLGPLGYRYYKVAAGGLCLRTRIEGDREHHELNYFFSVRPEAELAAVGLSIDRA